MQFTSFRISVLLTIRKQEKKDEIHFGLYICAALACCLAMVCSYTALQSPFSVPFAAQVVAKSAKPIPVMILGLIIGRKSYSIQRYCFVVLIVVGLVLTMFKDKKSNESSDDSTFLILGQILLMFSLFMDGILGAVQERMRGAKAPTALQMMLSTNGWSSMIMLPLVIFQMREFITFAAANPSVIAFITMLIVAGSIGQIFIFTMIASFGSLACSIVTTLRKFFNTLYSGVLDNKFTAMNWCGVFLVFAALIADIIFENKSNKKTIAEAQRENVNNLRNLEESKVFADAI